MTLHVVVPSLPDMVQRQAAAPGVGVARIAEAWDQLMVAWAIATITRKW